ncbi:hypothetical protein [Actinomycetospora chiangmaiensis]|uniref:hypothetical protein n=1 Tax=Actinomycetospora chiangmaiensis TaxID=402650 RepID=UPI0003688839|nr:hypothetical protein [Actinomycetospora chiangmaiensis]
MRRAVVLAAVLLGVLAGCADDNPASIPSGQSTAAAAPGAENRSSDAARNKLRLALADPCYTDPDARAVWPRCGRWVEETASTARSAANALPNDPAVTAAVAGVTNARDTYVGRGCPATAPGGTIDVSACVGGLVAARAATSALARALGTGG